MTGITPLSVYTKTAKGTVAAGNDSVELPAETAAALLLVDGKSTVDDLATRLGVDSKRMHELLATLAADGYIKLAASAGTASVNAVQTQAAAHPSPSEPELDLDLARQLTARVNLERRARDQVEHRLHSLEHGKEAPSSQTDDAGAFPKLTLPRDESRAAPPHASSQREEGYSTKATSAETGAEKMRGASPHRPNTLERAMLQAAAAAQARTATDEQHHTTSARSTAGHAASEPAPAQPQPAVRTNASPALEHTPPTFDGGNTAAAETHSNPQVSAVERGPDLTKRRSTELGAHATSSLQAQRRARNRRAVGMGAVGLLLLAIVLLQFLPLNGYIPAVEQALAKRLNQVTTVSTVRYVLLPTPRVVLEGLTIGDQAMRVERLDAHAWPTDFFGGLRRISILEAYGVDIPAGMLATIPAWTAGTDTTALGVTRLQLSKVRVTTPHTSMEDLAGDVTFAPDGRVQQALLANRNLKLEVIPRTSGLRVVLNARDWQLPLGMPLTLSELTLDGIADGQRFATTQLNARIGGGSLTGSLAAKWEGPISVGGQFQLTGARLEEITVPDTSQLAVKGVLAVDARYTMQADSGAELLRTSVLEARFHIARGELSSLDLVRAIQSAKSNWTRGGRTTFDALQGTVHVADATSRFRDLQLRSGPLEAAGHLEVAPGGQLSGRIRAQMRARGSVFARTPLAISGTLKEPKLTR